MILCLPRQACSIQLASPIVPWIGESDVAFSWIERSQAEADPEWQQIIPYAVVIDLNDRPWAYRRTGGDARLRERRSIGVGGHIEHTDDRGGLLATVRAALVRELAEELMDFPRQTAEFALPIAWINEQDSAVGRVHLGLVFAIPWGMQLPPATQAGEGLEPLGFVTPSTICEAAGYERWSVLAAQALRT